MQIVKTFVISRFPYISRMWGMLIEYEKDECLDENFYGKVNWTISLCVKNKVNKVLGMLDFNTSLVSHVNGLKDN